MNICLGESFIYLITAHCRGIGNIAWVNRVAAGGNIMSCRCSSYAVRGVLQSLQELPLLELLSVLVWPVLLVNVIPQQL